MSSGGGGRGFSAGRVASAPSSSGGFNGGSGGRPGGFHPQTNTAFRPAGNQGFHPQQNNAHQQQGGFHGGQQGFQPNNRGFNQQPHVNSAPHFAPGSGPGSASRGSTFKTALAGAAIGTVGGLLAFEAGKAIIHSATTPFNYNNNQYYWGQQNYQQKPGQFMCKMPLEQLIKESTPSTTTTTTTVAPEGVTADPNAATTTPPPNVVLSSLQFPDGTRPKEVVWSCRQGAEVCCGTECCPAPVQQNPSGASSSHGGSNIAAIVLGALDVSFSVLLVMLLIACCCCFAAYKLCRGSIESCLPNSNNQDNRHDQYDQSYKNDDNQSYPQQSYPMQPYNNQQQQHYNNQPQAYSAPQQYPSYPPQPSYVPPPKY
uniref:CX domain-containing protein n=1 Tax=Panagrellus redivivus TaxID=6233 RepID=A0A7E4WBQ2_PANRE